MTNEKRFECIGENMEVSIKDNESEMSEYPFSLCCESVDDFETLIQECLQMVGLLNHLHQENQILETDGKNQKESKEYWRNKAKRLEEENEQLRKEHQEMLEKYVLLKLKIGEVLNEE